MEINQQAHVCAPVESQHYKGPREGDVTAKRPHHKNVFKMALCSFAQCTLLRIAGVLRVSYTPQRNCCSEDATRSAHESLVRKYDARTDLAVRL